MKRQPGTNPILGIRQARVPLAGVLLFMCTSSLPASIIFTREAPGVQETSVAGATTVNFDLLPVGPIGPYVSPVGTYSAGGTIAAPDTFGGAHQTPYIAVGAQSGALQFELMLSGPRTYLGFYWAAGDALNRIDFYSGTTLEGTFSIGDIIPGLAAGYFGNPNTGQNPAEPYVYLNFTSSDLASRFDRVVFRNSTLASGFETDNHAIFDQIITPPGVNPLGVENPEPSSYALMATGIAGLLALVRRRRIT
jgi:hypothetical protein